MTTLTKNNVKIHKSAKEKMQNEIALNWNQIRTKVLELSTVLEKEKKLNTKDRKHLTVIGRERRSFAHKSLITALKHPNLIPSTSSVEEFQGLLSDEELVLGVLSEIEILKENVYNQYYELTHEEYQNALKVYRRSKMGAKEKEPGMSAIYKLLKKAYTNISRNKNKADKPLDLSEEF